MFHKLLDLIINYKTIFVGLSLIAASIALFGYMQILPAINSQLSPDEYIFIEHFVETQAHVIGNNDPSDISAYDYLGYQVYNYSNVSLQSQDYFPDINLSLKVFFTNGSSIGLAGCHGQSTYVYGIYSLPCDVNGIRILNVNNEGTAFIERNGKKIVLRPKDELVNISSTLTIANVRFNNSTVNKSLQINVTIIDRLRNFGICHKKNV